MDDVYGFQALDPMIDWT